MEYEISDDHGFDGAGEIARVRHSPVAPTSAPSINENHDRAMHIPEEEG